MTVSASDAGSGVSAAGQADVVWHGVTAEESCARLNVDRQGGLDSGEVEERRSRFGPNKLAEAKTEPGWRAFLRQYRDLMQLVLLGAAIVSMVALQEFSTGVVIIGLTVAERRARPEPGGQGGRERRRAAEDAPDQGPRAPPRRDAATSRPRSSCPGDIISFEAGDKIPADGRLLIAATLEIEEAALTGESTPVLEGARPHRRRRRAAGRPAGHGVHELHGHPRPRRDGRHGDGDVDRGRADLRDAEPGRGGEDAAHPPARPAHGADHHHGRGRAGARDRHRAVPRTRASTTCS